MIRFIIKVGIVLVIGILIYNYFLGSPEEKTQSEAVYDKVKSLTVSVVDVLKTEKTKFDQGKYDTAIDKVDQVFKMLKSDDSKLSDAQKAELKQLEDEKKVLKQDIDATGKMNKAEADKAAEGLDQRLLELLKRSEELIKEK